MSDSAIRSVLMVFIHDTIDAHHLTVHQGYKRYALDYGWRFTADDKVEKIYCSRCNKFIFEMKTDG